MSSRKKAGFEFVSAPKYYQALARGIPTAKKRIVIHAMTIIWGPANDVFVPMLEAALARGVDVRIVGDYYSKFAANRPRLIRQHNSPKWAHSRAVNYRLQDMGADITYVGKIGLNPFKGRTHSKVTIIDNTVYTFGGVNFTSESFDNHDYMLTKTDGKLADRLAKLVATIASAKKPLPDLSEKLDEHTTMLFDGGTPGESVIYSRAVELVSAAKKVYYVSQMCPSGRLASAIGKRDNDCYFIRALQADPPANLALIFDRTRYSVKNKYHGKGYIHAKFILCENSDGSKHLLSGSNNFSWRGIAYGTKEIAIHSTDKHLWDSFYTYMQDNIIESSAAK